MIDSADPRRWTQGWGRLVLAAGMLAYPLVTASGVAQYATGRAAVVGYGAVTVFAACYVFAAVAVRRQAWPRFWAFVVLMAGLFLGTVPIAREMAFFLVAVVVSMVVIRVRGWTLPGLVVAAAAALAVPPLAWRAEPAWGPAVAVVFTVLTVYAYAEIASANTALVQARAEVARLASEGERSRIARDLHDLLGHSLTTITVKSELARRLVPAGHDRLAQEIADVEELSRQALADARAAVSGYRQVTLAGELARGRELLRASRITAELPTATDLVSASHQELFGAAVREGLTNVVRHAQATWCAVRVSPSEVDIRDDGVGRVAPEGNGLAGLRERAAAFGGAVTAGPLEPCGWRLTVSVRSS